MLDADHAKLSVATWIDVRGEQLMPRASQYGAFQMRPFLPNVVIFRRVAEGEYIVSLQGTALVDAFGFDATGKDVSVAYPDHEVPGLMTLFGFIFSGNYLSHSRREYTRTSGASFTVEQLLLPIADEDGQHDRYVLLVCNVPKPKRSHANHDAPPDLGDLRERTVYDPRTLLPVPCFATTQRDDAAMNIPITAGCD